MFVAGASSETADSQGRVVIPQALREYAALTKDVVLLGQIRRVEIWDKAEWERYRAVAEAAYADETNAAHLAELGI
jgi:MraZ protein